MALQSALHDLVASVPGILGAILADWEGEAVERVARMDDYERHRVEREKPVHHERVARMDDYELRVAGAHQGVILCHLRAAVGRLGGDRLHEIIITTDRSQTVVLPLTDEYFLVVFLERTAILGQVLVASRRCLARLRPEVT